MKALLPTSYVAFFGLFPELLWIVEMIIHGIIDLIFYQCEGRVRVAEDRYYLHTLDKNEPQLA